MMTARQALQFARPQRKRTTKKTWKIYRRKCGQQALASAGERWKRQHEEQDGV